MAFRWRKWNKAIHRDFGYFFLGMTIIYGLSGIALNHLKDWNPNYIIVRKEITVKPTDKQLNKEEIKQLLAPINEEKNYKNHYYPGSNSLKIFIEGGTVYINTATGIGLLEKTKRRPIFREVNYLHYNPIKYWTWYSDLFSGALILLGITGILIPRGSHGITKRGAWLTLLGFIIPFIYLMIYFY